MDNTFSDGDVAALLRIAGEVGEIERDLRVRRTHVLNGIVDLVGGCWAVCSELDPRHVHDTGWAIPNSIICSKGLSASQQGLIDHYLRGDLDALDPCIPHLLRDRSRVTTLRRMDVVDGSWFRSDHFNYIRRPLGIGESLYGKLITPDGRHLKLSLHRESNDSPFTARHVRLLQTFNENLAGLYVVPAQSTAQAAGASAPDSRVASLPPRLRPVLQRLLAGDAEKQVAMKLGLSPHTVHEYTKGLYRTFGVNSRGELLAQFVSAVGV